jgi:hypothetical protein
MSDLRITVIAPLAKGSQIAISAEPGNAAATVPSEPTRTHSSVASVRSSGWPAVSRRVPRISQSRRT